MILGATETHMMELPMPYKRSDSSSTYCEKVAVLYTHANWNVMNAILGGSSWKYMSSKPSVDTICPVACS